MVMEVLASLGKKAPTTKYPFEKYEMPPKFRGKIKFIGENCIGCKICMRDCPSKAIEIIKVADKQFDCVVSYDKCIYCAQCVDSCPRKALEVTGEFELAVIDRGSLKVTFKGPPKPAAPAADAATKPAASAPAKPADNTPK